MSEDGVERCGRVPKVDRSEWSSPNERPRVLDLYCGRGGVGLALDELDVEYVGFDRTDYSECYPGEFVQCDLTFPHSPLPAFAADLVWASPPCTAYSSLSPTEYGSREAALEENPRIGKGLRDIAMRNGAHYIIENVPGATREGDLNTNVRINGLGLGKDYDLERHFETSFPCPDAYESGTPSVSVDTRNDQSIEDLAEAKGVPPSWGKQGVRSAIPREYVHWLLHHCPIEELRVPKPSRPQATLTETLATDGGRSR